MSFFPEQIAAWGNVFWLPSVNASFLVVVVSAASIMMIMMEYGFGVLFFLGAGIAAIALTFGFLGRWSVTTTICGVCFYFVVLFSMLLSQSQNDSIVSQTTAISEIVKTRILGQREQQHLNWQQIEAQIEAALTVMTMLWPLLNAMAVSGILCGVIVSVLKMQRAQISSRGQFSEWEISEHCLWLIILAVGLYHFQATRIVGINLLIGGVLLYYLQGSSLIIFFLKQRQVSKGMIHIAYGLFFLQIPSVFFLVGLLLNGYPEKGMILTLSVIFMIAGMGLANVWYGFRKRAKGESSG